LDIEEEKIKRGERIADGDFQRFNKNKKFNNSGKWSSFSLIFLSYFEYFIFCTQGLKKLILENGQYVMVNF